MLALTAALVVALYLTLEAMSLTGEQEVQKELGRFDYAANVPLEQGVSPTDAVLVRGLSQAAARAAGEDGMITLNTVDVRPAVTDPPTTYYTEAPWEDHPFPDRYRLLQGHWPKAPGEIVVPRTTSGSLSQPGTNLDVLAGRASLRVVGEFDDLFGNYRAQILAAPGTFTSLPIGVQDAFPTLSAYATVYVAGDSPEPVLRQVSAALEAQDVRGTRDPLAELRLSSRSALDVAEARDASWVAQIPAGYSLPSLLLPALAALSIFGVQGRRLRRNSQVLIANGVPPWVCVVGLGAALLFWLTVGVLLGVAIGAGLGVGVREYLAHSWFQPLSPMPTVTGPLVRMVLAVLLASVVAAVALRYSARQGSEPVLIRSGPRAGSRTMIHVRHGLATLAACASIVGGLNLDTSTGSMLLAGTFTATMLLLVPELTGLALRGWSTRSPRARLARRQLAYDASKSSAIVAVLAAMLALPLTFLALLGTFIATAATNTDAAQVAPHQVAVSGIGGHLTPGQPAVIDVVRRNLPADTRSLQVRLLSRGTDTEVVEVMGSGLGGVLAADNPDDVAALANRALSEQERRTLEDGGMLVWDGRSDATRSLLDPSRTTAEPVSVSAVNSSFPAAWRVGIHGIMLTGTASRNGLPTLRGAVVFVGVPDAAAQRAAQAVLDAGLDPDQVLLYTNREPAYVPRIMYFTAIGLVAVGVLTGGAFARTQVKSMHRYLGSLVALGLTPGWITKLLLLQQGWLVSVATAIALLCAVVPTVVLAVFAPGYVLEIPGRWLSLVVAAFGVSLLGGVFVASRGITATQRSSS